jgi:hypothetical protein
MKTIPRNVLAALTKNNKHYCNPISQNVKMVVGARWSAGRSVRGGKGPCTLLGLPCPENKANHGKPRRSHAMSLLLCTKHVPMKADNNVALDAVTDGRTDGRTERQTEGSAAQAPPQWQQHTHRAAPTP